WLGALCATVCFSYLGHDTFSRGIEFQSLRDINTEVCSGTLERSLGCAIQASYMEGVASPIREYQAGGVFRFESLEDVNAKLWQRQLLGFTIFRWPNDVGLLASGQHSKLDMDPTLLPWCLRQIYVFPH